MKYYIPFIGYFFIFKYIDSIKDNCIPPFDEYLLFMMAGVIYQPVYIIGVFALLLRYFN